MPTAPNRVKPANVCPKPKVSIFARIANFIQNLSKTITGLILIIALVVIAVLSYRTLRHDSILIEPFNVPSAIASRGYNGEVFANKLIDQFKTIREYTDSRDSGGEPVFTPRWEFEDEIDIPGTSPTFGNLLQRASRLLGCKITVISNEIVMQNDVLEITTRINGQQIGKTTGSQQTLDKMLFQLAKNASKYIQPKSLASYYFGVRDYDNCLETVKYMIEHEPASDDALAYVLWGDVLAEDKKDFAGAEAKYQRALNLDSKNYEAYNDWGTALYAQGKYEEAIKKYEEAIEIDSKSALSNINLGITLSEQGELDEAIEQFERTIEKAKDVPASIHLDLARTYLKKDETDKALESLEEAIEQDSSLKEEIAAEETLAPVAASAEFKEIIDK